MNVTDIPAITQENIISTEHLRTQSLLGTVFISNPIDTTSHQPTPPPLTQTLPAREVYHQVQAELRPLLNSVHTQEELTDFLTDIRNIRLVELYSRFMDPYRS